MVTKAKKGTGEKKGKVKIDKLKLNKETVRNLSDSEAKKVKGGYNSNGCGPKFSFCGQITCPPQASKLGD
jgi:natural product precursor